MYCKKMFLFLFLFSSMLLLCSFFRLKELFQVKNGSTTLLLFFENAKNLGWLDDTKQKKRGWPKKMKYFLIIWVKSLIRL